MAAETGPPDSRTRGQRALLAIGSLGPLGHLPASGTVTVAVVGVPAAWLLRTLLPVWGFALWSVAFALSAVWLHDVGDRLLGEKDSRKLVWDELAGFWFAVILAPRTWPMFVAAFFLERLMDILKVPPANIIENKVGGGAGVVGDDVVAGVYTLLVLLVVERFVPAHLWGG